MKLNILKPGFSLLFFFLFFFFLYKQCSSCIKLQDFFPGDIAEAAALQCLFHLFCRDPHIFLLGKIFLKKTAKLLFFFFCEVIQKKGSAEMSDPGIFFLYFCKQFFVYRTFQEISPALFFIVFHISFTLFLHFLTLDLS